MSASSTRSSPTACCCGTARTSCSPTPAMTRTASAPSTSGVGADAGPCHGAALPFLGGAPLPEARQRRGPGRHRGLRRPALRPGQPRRPHVPAAPRRRARPAAPRPRGAGQAAQQAGRAHHAYRGTPVPEAGGQAAGADCRPTSGSSTGNMGEVLDRTDLLVTVSSTAALESLHRRHPDRRPHRPRHARDARQPPLPRLRLPCLLGPARRADTCRSPTRDWLGRQGVAADGSYETAFDAARRARSPRCHGRHRLPPLTPYYTPATAPGYLPGILARYGFGPDGAPLPGAASGDVAESGGGLRRVVRNTVRDAARGAYRHGVQRVAPVIRRMGEL